jgi:hypothetical protein
MIDPPAYANLAALDVSTRFSKDMIESIIEDRAAPTRDLREVSRKVIRLQDEGVRQALIALGWTPPPENPDGP